MPSHFLFIIDLYLQHVLPRRTGKSDAVACKQQEHRPARTLANVEPSNLDPCKMSLF